MEWGTELNGERQTEENLLSLERRAESVAGEPGAQVWPKCPGRGGRQRLSLLSSAHRPDRGGCGETLSWEWSLTTRTRPSPQLASHREAVLDQKLPGQKPLSPRAGSGAASSQHKQLYLKQSVGKRAAPRERWRSGASGVGWGRRSPRFSGEDSTLTARAGLQPLVREIRSHKPRSMAKIT